MEDKEPKNVNHFMSQKEVAEELKVSREVVSYIEVRALKKIHLILQKLNYKKEDFL
jgi:transcriptional regulator